MRHAKTRNDPRQAAPVTALRETRNLAEKLADSGSRGMAGTVLGHLGVGLPYAIGAKLAAPGSPVMLLTGDLARGFSMIEFETVRHQIPVVVVGGGDDQAWGNERYYQSVLYGRERLTRRGLSNIRWEQMALALGGCGEYVETPEPLRSALQRAFASFRPACVNVPTQTVPSPLAQSCARMLRRRRATQKNCQGMNRGRTRSVPNYRPDRSP
jgi:acetolactate synthase-1/2/3 large subunit